MPPRSPSLRARHPRSCRRSLRSSSLPCPPLSVRWTAPALPPAEALRRDHPGLMHPLPSRSGRSQIPQQNERRLR
eukprot:12900857-Prorocentrum_lima.AAC.1